MSLLSLVEKPRPISGRTPNTSKVPKVTGVSQRTGFSLATGVIGIVWPPSAHAIPAKRPGSFASVYVTHRLNIPASSKAAAVAAPRFDCSCTKRSGSLLRKRPKEHPIEHRERQCVRADAQRHGQYRRECKSRRL